MGIALGYAFLLAIAGSLAAICVAYFLELAEDDGLSGRETRSPLAVRTDDLTGASPGTVSRVGERRRPRRAAPRAMGASPFSHV